MFDWKNFLDQWVEATQEIGTPAVIQRGASEAEIAALEARLGRTLPPSYRAFLAASNGLITPDDRIRPAHEVNWFAHENQDLIDTWLDSDMPMLDPSTLHLKTLLQISDEDDTAYMLLNPQVINPDTGEWEAWFFSNWLPGWDMYDSFQEMMQDFYASMVDIEFNRVQRQQVVNAPREVKDALSDMAANWQQMADEMTAGLGETFNMDTFLKMMFPEAEQRARMQSHLGELETVMENFNQRMLQWVQTGSSTASPLNSHEDKAAAAQFHNLIENIRAEAQAVAPVEMDLSVLPDLDTLNDALLKLGTVQGLNMAAGQLRSLLNTPPDDDDTEAE